MVGNLKSKVFIFGGGEGKFVHQNKRHPIWIGKLTRPHNPTPAIICITINWIEVSPVAGYWLDSSMNGGNVCSRYSLPKSDYETCTQRINDKNTEAELFKTKNMTNVKIYTDWLKIIYSSCRYINGFSHLQIYLMKRGFVLVFKLFACEIHIPNPYKV